MEECGRVSKWDSGQFFEVPKVNSFSRNQYMPCHPTVILYLLGFKSLDPLTTAITRLGIAARVLNPVMALYGFHIACWKRVF